MSVNYNSPNLQETVMQHVQESIKSHIASIFDKAVEQATKDALAKRDDLVAQTALRMSNWVQIQENRTNLVITIEKPKGK